MILVVSSKTDLHAQEVLASLKKRNAPVFLLDLSKYPTDSRLTIGFSSSNGKTNMRLESPEGNVDFSECRVAWWRRPQPFTLHPEIVTPDQQDFAVTEAHSAFSGLWLTMKAFWINHPTRDEEAARKVHQLEVAQDIGFRIPETCITSDFERAREFIGIRGPEETVYKAFSGTEQAWRETRLLKTEEMELLENVRYAPVIFQEYIPAHTDLRITVVGEKLFPAAIYSQETDYKVDFRMNMGAARFKAVELPDEVEGLLREFMSRLGLVYGAIDMRLTPDGEYVFLEINPSGQWLFIEKRTGQPITETLVDLMITHDQVLGQPNTAVPGS